MALLQNIQTPDPENARTFQLVSSVSAFLAGLFLLASVVMGLWDQGATVDTRPPAAQEAELERPGR